MSDTNGEQPHTAKIVINYDDQTGAVEVEGPLDQAVLCYGMLEAAKEVIIRRQFQHYAKQQMARAGRTPGGLHLPGGMTKT